ncbi:outer membrane beta-barrel family protein [Chryseolinea soli]|uniref:TonB-dependent receptor n=1 Tax=Chryseolinea soli TaxID=2321403 RepID=A0A385SXG7_9BACT|nr:outer membrane beta-barrel family protein [Chryseolinea soli]AYB35041.1 TonB-dependent receptor [Chryseolinea soli]
MKLLFFTSVLLCLLQYAQGQVSGKVTTPDKQPLPFVNVLLLNAADSSLAKGAVATETGEYKIDGVAAGDYFLRFSLVGYKTDNVPVFKINANEARDFGVQVLEEDSQQLDEIVVQAERPLYQQEVDRTVVNVENSVMTKGSSALQVLERSPGVFVDMRNNSLALNGKTSVMLMINGKLIRLPMAQVVAMLNGMSANDIEKIELITSPPARYDAEGTAGMINIVIKKHEEIGTTGSFSVTGGQGWGEKGNGSVSVSHNTGKANFYGSYSFLHDRTRDGWVAQSTQNMPAFGGELSVDVGSTTKGTTNNHNATLGFDINAPKATLGGSATYNTSRGPRNIYNHGNYTILASDSLLVMHATIDGQAHWGNLVTNLYLDKPLREGEKLNIDLDYLRYSNESPTEINTIFLDREGREAQPSGNIFSNRQRGVSQSPIQVGVFKTDYTRQWHNIKFEAGLKGTLTASSSLSRIETYTDGAWTGSARYTNDTDMRETIAAAYSSVEAQVAPAVRLIAGLRYEYSHTRANADKEENNIDRKLGKLFPSVFLTRRLNDHAELQFSYTKRITRPSYNDLASYLLYNDPMSVSTGNPSLRPTISNNLKIGYTYNGYSFSLQAGRDDHPIILYQQKESPARDLMYLAPQNMAYQNNLTFQANLPFTINNWWSMSYSVVGGLRQFKLDHTVEKLRKTYFAYTLNGSQTFTLPANFSLEVSGWYNSSQYEGSKKIRPFGMLNAGLKKDLRHNWGSVQLAVTDIFKSMRVNGFFGTLTEEAFSLKAEYTYKAESANYRIVKLTYSKTFGNTKMKSRGSRDAVSTDERERIRKN